MSVDPNIGKWNLVWGTDVPDPLNREPVAHARPKP